tara:strand:+ start:293 stop:904 length:612 start_codon:yes stop_codon:yes gene_type:complete
MQVKLRYNWSKSYLKRVVLIKSHQNLDEIKKQVLHWVQSFIVALNICPFARHVLVGNRLEINVSTAKDLESALDALMSEIYHLDENINVETTLLIFPYQFSDFLEYLNFVEMAEKLLSIHSYEGTYQLATFHPEYCFAHVSTDDVSNYTNRSPYPMLHLLRESSLDKAIDSYGDTSVIPEKNIKLMHQLGLNKIKQLIQLKDE